MLLMGQNAMSIIYVGLYKPMKRRNENYLELYNEYIIGYCTIILIAFTQFVYDPYSKFFAGWISVVFFLMLIVVNVFSMMFTTCHSLNVVRRKYYKRLQFYIDQRKLE